MLNDFEPPHPVQFQGQTWARRVLGWLGWTVHFDGLPAAQGVLIVYPHTSNWDFVIAMLVKATMGLRIHFWAKETLFRIPGFSTWLTHLGAVPVDRQNPAGVVQGAVHDLNQARLDKRLYWIGLSPEGTRAFRPGWRSGFYRLALQADVPLGVGTLDYAKREVRVQHFIRLSGDQPQDYARIEAIVGQAVGFHPQQACPVRPLPAPASAVKESS